MAEYVQATEKLLVRQDRVEALKRTDTVIFDIDGVLIDVRSSFREAIRETVQYFLKKNYDLDSLKLLVAPEEIHQFKMAGGFNNDWDLAEGLLAFYIKKIRNHKVKNLLELKSIDPELGPFLNEVKLEGGGLEKLYGLLFRNMPEDDQKGMRNEVHRSEIEQIFQEVYAGIDYCQRLYKRRPSFFRGTGKIENEKNILNRELLQRDRFGYGILTGRTKSETELALEKLGLAESFDPEAVVYDDGTCAAKPDPEGLIRLTGYLEAKHGIYCGDLVDDWKAADRFAQEGRSMAFCYCLTGSTDETTVAWFKQAGADLIADDVNELLTWLNDGVQGASHHGPQSTQE